MASANLKALNKTWGHACKTMWVEIAGLRHLQGRLLGDYARIEPTRLLTDLAYAPECKGRLNDATKDFFLGKVEEYVNEAALLRVVLLSAAFETFFDAFVDLYLQRPKFSPGGARTSEANQVSDAVRKARGPVARIQAFFDKTGAKSKSIAPKDLDVLGDVYILRSIIAHRAGTCDTSAATTLKIFKFSAGQRVSVTPEQLVADVAPPCFSLAKNFDERL